MSIAAGVGMQGAVCSLIYSLYSLQLLLVTSYYYIVCSRFAASLPCIHDLKICSLCRLEWAQIEYDIRRLRVKDSIKEMEKIGRF